MPNLGLVPRSPESQVSQQIKLSGGSRVEEGLIWGRMGGKEAEREAAAIVQAWSDDLHQGGDKGLEARSHVRDML